MPIYKKKNKCILFIHIPKTGGSSIETAFRNDGWQEFRFSPSGGEKSQHAIFDVWSCWRELNNYNFRPGEDKIEKIFTVVRDPMDRIRSEIRSSRPSLSSFEGYTSRLTSYIDAYKKKPSCRDNHIRPQVDYLPPNIADYHLPLRIYYFEDSDHRQEIIERYGLNIDREQFPHITGTGGSARHVTPWDGKKLPEPIIRSIHKTYKEDYIKLGYSK